MKRLIAILMVLVGGMVLTTIASADDVADAVLELLAAMNAGDVHAWTQKTHPERSIFFYGGELLSEGFDKNSLKAALDAGLKFDCVIRHLGVKVYGNAAVVTGYNVGTLTLPDGTSQQGSRRFSEVWIKTGGQWKQVHRHASRVLPALSQ